MPGRPHGTAPGTQTHGTAPGTVGTVAKVRQARRCRAHRKDGQPCRCFAVIGAPVCRVHGGAAGQVKRKARERQLEAAAYRLLATWTPTSAAWEYRERAGLAADLAAVEAFARRLG